MTGSIQVRDLKKGRKYYCVWRVNGRQKWKAFDKRKEAERYLTTVVKATHDGTYQDVQPLAMKEVFDCWLDDSLGLRIKQGLLKDSTAKSYRSMLETHLRPAFGEYRSDRLTHAVTAAWARRMADEIAEGNITPKFYNNLLNLLHAILIWARHPAQGDLAHDPLIGLKRLLKPPIEREFLELREIQALLGAATPPDDTILHMPSTPGCAAGNCSPCNGATWIGGLARMAAASGSNDHSTRGKLRPRKPSLPSASSMCPSARLMNLASTVRCSPQETGGFILRTVKGTPVDPDNWYKRRFLLILERAGLRQVGLHALRHTYASLLINQGESIKYVSKQLGHASIQITSDLYGHLFRETSVSAMRRLEQSMIGGGFPSNIHLTEQATTP